MSTLIRFGFSESEALAATDGLVATLEYAEQLIQDAADVAPDNGCYDKTDLTVIVDGEDVYGIRLDIKAAHQGQSNIIAGHLARALTHYSARLAEGGPFAKYITPEHIAGIATALAAVRAA